jgi:translation initiation factor 2 subunit 2
MRKNNNKEINIMYPSYEKLLERAWQNIPEKLKSKERFEIPKVKTLIEGNQTIVKNFYEISSKLRRDPKHLLSYLSRELAAPALLDGNRMTIQRVLREYMINKKIELYVKEYVLCEECNRPDTKITELEGEKIIKCEACGAWRPFRKV